MSESSHISPSPLIPQSAEKGRLKVYLGYAAGVGKTFRMLADAQLLKAEGRDVVIGYFEPHKRPDTIAQTTGLEEVPRKHIEYRGVHFTEMDTEAIISRKPEICLVDEFAHTNVPGCERAKRWEDVLLLLDAGIGVVTNMNVQHLESLNDQVQHISGVRVRETVPDWVIAQADEVVMVDLTPSALLNRLERGVVYDADKASKAMENFFKEGTLAALRELALRQTAHEVDARQRNPDPQMPWDSRPQAEAASEQGSNERILIVISDHPSTAMLIRRGKRVADYLRAECYAVHVQGPLKKANGEGQVTRKMLNFARQLHIETREIAGTDAAAALADFARQQQITQIYLARAQYGLWDRLMGGNFIHRIVRLARDMQVTIVAERARGDA